MQFIKKHPLLTIFIIGFLIRLSLIFIDFGVDVNNHISWSHDAFTRGLSGLYETKSQETFCCDYPNYPPLAILIFLPFYLLRLFIFNFFWQINLKLSFFPSKIILFMEKRSFIAGLFKLPAIFFDLGLAYLCYLFARQLFPKDKRKHFLAAALILLHPVFFYNSAFWGQIEAIPIFFLMAAVYLLMFSKHNYLSITFYIFALLVKPTVLVGLPIFTIFYVKKFGLSKALKAFLFGNVIFCLFFLPFYKSGNLFLFPYQTYSQKVISAQSINFITNSAFNFWAVFKEVMKGKDTLLFLGPLSYRTIGYLLTALFSVIILLQFNRKNNVIVFLFQSSLFFFTAFLFLTRMHERYLIYALPFLLFMALKDRGIMKYFLIISTTIFINMYYSWPVPKIQLLYQTIRVPLVISFLSLINLFVYASFLRKMLQPVKQEK